MATVTYLETLSSKPRARTDDISRPSAQQELAKIADRIGEDRNTTIIESNVFNGIHLISNTAGGGNSYSVLTISPNIFYDNNFTKNQWEMLNKLLKLRVTVHSNELVIVNVALPPVRDTRDTQIEFSRLWTTTSYQILAKFHHHFNGYLTPVG